MLNPPSANPPANVRSKSELIPYQIESRLFLHSRHPLHPFQKSVFPQSIPDHGPKNGKMHPYPIVHHVHIPQEMFHHPR